MTTPRVLVAIGLLLIGSSPVLADDLSKALLGVLQAQADALSRGNFDDFKKTVHSQAPSYFNSMKMMRDLTSAFRVRGEISNFKLIGQDGDYAFARCTVPRRPLR